ncbi:MAG TPA: hypothetical protein VJ965_07645 [Anaerolineales bacterium]|nr:hypothetical protein [Anaerolineales bacterium]
MTQRQPMFAGLVVDEYDNAVEVSAVGDEPMYVVNDAGFRRHIPAEQVDRAVLDVMTSMIEGNEDELSKQAATMLGQDDIFSQAILENQLMNIEDQIDQMLESGIPEEGRAYLGMMGFKIRINFHGDLLEVIQPGMIAPDDE